MTESRRRSANRSRIATRNGSFASQRDRKPARSSRATQGIHWSILQPLINDCVTCRTAGISATDSTIVQEPGVVSFYCYRPTPNERYS